LKRVAMLTSHPLFGEGVEILLRKEAGLEVVGRETDVDSVIDLVKELRLDVVVVDSADAASEPITLVMRILREGVRTSVIGLNLEDNTMCVYRREKRIVTEVKDLVEAIEGRAAA
jgi:DNA-binding NarL/FixJ family response regulator